MKIQLTKFAIERHWSKTFKGTRITSVSPDDFKDLVEKYVNIPTTQHFNLVQPNIIDGYAPFCKLLCMKNYTGARTGTLPLTLENYQYLRSGYSARRPGELSVLSRWLDLPLPPPVANHLMIVLYTREQLYKEHKISWAKLTSEHSCAGNPITPEPFELDIDTDYGIVSIMAQMGSEEEPMKPVTMMRNALGVEEGGSGVPIDPEEYSKSVEFWSTHAIVR